MLTSHDSLSVEMLDIAVDGDMILVVGPSPLPVAKLRVHSVILKTASKVIIAMFGPRFREGQA